MPAFISLLYLLATIAIYTFESNYLQNVDSLQLLFHGDIKDAQSLAGSLLSSMITMATLIISVMMVVLSLAATQLGPRLIRTFMSDRRTKTYIALFFGAIISCYILTIILYDVPENGYTPKLTITTVFLICFSNLFVLLAFVHHVAQSSIADNVITRVANDITESLNRLTLSEENADYSEPDLSDWPKDFERKQSHLYFERSGYVQNINYDHIMTLCESHGLFAEIHFKAGHFLVQGEDGVRIYPKNKLDEETEYAIRRSFIIGNTRTPTQDIEYSVRHLVEIGLRALSPGMDDNFTAITVLDRLSAALAVLFKKETPKEWIQDSEGRYRMWTKQSSDADIIFSAFDQLRHSAREKPDIIMHLLKKMKILCKLARTKGQIAGLKRQILEIEYDLKHIDKLVQNIDDMHAQCKELRSILKEKEL